MLQWTQSELQWCDIAGIPGRYARSCAADLHAAQEPGADTAGCTHGGVKAGAHIWLGAACAGLLRLPGHLSGKKALPCTFNELYILSTSD